MRQKYNRLKQTVVWTLIKKVRKLLRPRLLIKHLRLLLVHSSFGPISGFVPKY